MIGSLEEKLVAAFAGRSRPEQIASATQESEITRDAQLFQAVRCEEVTCGLLESAPDCVFGFTADAFVYFLPCILRAIVAERRPDILVVMYLLQMLDRSNVPSLWDTRFIETWGSLTSKECHAVQSWILWLVEEGYEEGFEGILDRSFATLTAVADIKLSSSAGQVPGAGQT